MDRLEKIILKNLIYNDEYTKKTIPFLKDEYFSDNTEKTVFNKISSFISKYNDLPSHEALIIDLMNDSSLSPDTVQESVQMLNEIHLEKDSISGMDWLIEHTEGFCQDKAIYNAIRESITILDGSSKTVKAKGEIPKLLSDALAVSFDNNIGHDYIDDPESRYDAYHRVESKIKFDLDYFNRITKGGLSVKTLNIALAGTGVGKSLFMCHVAAGCLVQGYNVLYITMEMSEEKIAERIDANLMDVEINKLHNLKREDYLSKFAKVSGRSSGKLIIKEYPTATASALHFRTLINDLKLKKGFVPQIIFIDYLNICCSSRLKYGSNVNSYLYIKSIAEELRGLAIEMNVPIVSATQTTRSGYASSDPGLDDTSESFGLPATADFMFALISNEELEALGQIMVKQLKNRYTDLNFNKRFVVGIEKAKMRLFDVDMSAQENISDAGEEDVPLNTFGDREKKRKFNFK